METSPKPAGPLTREEIAGALARIAPRGELRDEKRAAVEALCKARRGGVNADAHAIWDTLDDFPEY